MTKKPSRSNPWPPKRLDRVEEVLRSVRPRPSRLTAEAVLERASSDDTGTEGDTALPQPERRRVPMLFTSWTCGAAVGAAVTYLMMSLVAPPVPPNGVVQPHVPSQESLVGRAQPSGSAVSSDEPAPSTESLQNERLVMLTDRLWDVRISEFPDGSPLRAGLRLNPADEHSQHRGSGPLMTSREQPFADNDDRPRVPQSINGDARERANSFSPSTGMTRQQMLAELLDEGG